MNTKGLILERLREEKYINDCINNALYEVFTLNEEVSIDNIKEKAKEYLERLKTEYNSLSDSGKKKLKRTAVITLLGLIGLNGGLEPDLKADTEDVNHAKIELSAMADDILDSDEFKTVKINNPYEKAETNKTKKVNSGKFVRPNPKDTEISDKLLNHLKTFEGFRSKAYDLGDGAITIGYGHAIFKDRNRTDNHKTYDFLPRYEDIKIGKTSITKEQAEILLRDDYAEAKKGLDKIFNDWQAQGIEFYITQEMYDAMISLIFNTGINNFRKGDVIALIKKGPEHYDEAMAEIKKTSDNLFKKYPGLKTRRKSESGLFNLGIKKLANSIKDKVFDRLRG
jgi:GH24 family phage-related lysozyme (muramidase)